MSFHATGLTSAVGNSRTALRQITTEQLRALGSHQIAYVRAGTFHGDRTFVLFSADGTPIGRAASKDAVFETVDEFDLTVVAIH